MSIIKYRTFSTNSIERIEVLRETEQSVFLPSTLTCGERRESKIGSYWSYHDSWEAALAYLISEAEKKVRTSQLRLNAAKGALNQLKGMKPPKEAAA
jgi:hypothetical protein